MVLTQQFYQKILGIRHTSYDESPAPYPHLMSTLFALASRREGGDFRDTLNTLRKRTLREASYALRLVEKLIVDIALLPKPTS